MRQAIIFVLGFFCVSSIFAANYESVENIKTIAKNFVEQNTKLAPDETIETSAQSINSKLRLAVCSTPIEAAFPKGSTKNDTVELTCNGIRPWHVYIPVSIKIMTKVLTASRSLMPRDSIRESDVEFAPIDKKLLYNGSFVNKEEVVGKSASRIIPAGTVLTSKNIEEPILVSRNQVIDLVATKKSMTVVMKGVAKVDGRMGETIKVFNPSSKRTIDAIVSGTSKAEAIS